MIVIEKQYMDSRINTNCMMCKAQDAAPDWEQRRYEIAKDVATHAFCAALCQPLENGVTYEELAEAAIKTADALITILQEKK